MHENKDSSDLSAVDIEARPQGGLRRKLYIIIFETETALGKRFDIMLLVAIFISILAVILESDKEVSRWGAPFFDYLEWSLTVVFTIEYLLRLYVSKYPLRYALSFFGLVDLISVIPSYVGLIFPGPQYLKVIRVLRLLRVFRILKLGPFVKASQHLGQALIASRYKILIFLGVILSLVLIMGTCMYMVEGQQSGFSSIPKSMYWAIVTMTTVGYGDIVPQTAVGKFIASMMMLIGYAIIAVPTGIVTGELIEAQKNGEGSKCLRCFADVLVESAHYCHVCGEKLRK